METTAKERRSKQFIYNFNTQKQGQFQLLSSVILSPI
jgi:hypothetical protein